MAEWIKQEPTAYCIQEIQFSYKDTHRRKVKGQKIFHASGKQKRSGDKTDFKSKAITRDKEGHYVMIRWSSQEDITIVNIYATNIRTPKLFTIVNNF